MPEALIAKAIEALQREDFATACACIDDYESKKPLELQHYLIRGLAELALKNWSAAQNTFSAAAMRYPQDAQLFFNLGIAQENLGDIKNAAKNYEHGLELKPGQADACGNLSNVYYRLSRFAEAEAMARQALELGAPRVQALNSLGLALDRQNKSAEAKAAYEEALKLSPDDHMILSNYANYFVDRFQFDEAWKHFAVARAKSDTPVIRHHEGMARLLAGDFENGWPLHEARIEVRGGLRVRPFVPRYHGEALANKTILLIAEQGYGDVIQFCRYGALLEKKGAKLVWVVPKNLKRLLAANLSGQVIAENEALPQADFYLPILSLPYALGLLKPEDAPKAPYLKAPEKTPLLPPSNGKRKIGLVWAGSSTHERDYERSIAPSHFAKLMEKIAAQFYAPFVGTGLEQAADLPLIRLDDRIKDFADTAALLSQMDCLISVDTAVAHLAGALGVKTYLLLPHLPDWRWGIKGEATPWYGHFTLLRQQWPGEWDTPPAKLGELLTESA